jgi:hypothetical protein
VTPARSMPPKYRAGATKLFVRVGGSRANHPSASRRYATVPRAQTWRRWRLGTMPNCVDRAGQFRLVNPRRVRARLLIASAPNLAAPVLPAWGGTPWASPANRLMRSIVRKASRPHAEPSELFAIVQQAPVSFSHASAHLVITCAAFTVSNEQGIQRSIPGSLDATTTTGTSSSAHVRSKIRSLNLKTLAWKELSFQLMRRYIEYDCGNPAVDAGPGPANFVMSWTNGNPHCDCSLNTTTPCLPVEFGLRRSLILRGRRSS